MREMFLTVGGVTRDCEISSCAVYLYIQKIKIKIESQTVQ